jgi:hypothetical protein
MPKKVVFFNHFHNGDIHVSRGLVRQVISKVRQIDPSTQFFYAHRNSGVLLQDIPGLVFDGRAMSNISSEHVSTFSVGDTTYFNTWYAQQNFQYMNRYGLTFDALYSAFDNNCKSIWGFSLDSISSDPSVFFPSIDYNAFHIGRVKNWLAANPSKKIFISNGAILSDQAHQFALTPIIDAIAKKHADKIFILSNHDGHPGSSNIVHSSDIIRCPGNDLNENSFIASHCDVIIGRASGAFSFSITQQNLFQRDVKFLAFCNLAPVPPNRDFWVGELLRDKIKYKAQFVINNDSDTNNIQKLIEVNL